MEPGQAPIFGIAPAGGPRLRPMGLADLLDASFALYRQNFALFAGVAALIGVPEAIINALLSAIGGPSTTTRTTATGQSVSVNGLAISLSGVTGLIQLIFGALITGALAYAISRRYLGEGVAVQQAYVGVGRRGFLRVLGAIGVGLLVALALVAVPTAVIVLGLVAGLTLITVLGVLLIFVAAIAAVVVYIHFVFVPQSVVVDGLGVFDALRRSWRLVAGSAWRVFGIVLVLGIMVAIVTGIVGGIAGAVLVVSSGDRSIQFVAQLIAQLVSVLVEPFQLVGLTLLYFDLRIRKEGFDLEHLVQSLDAAPVA